MTPTTAMEAALSAPRTSPTTPGLDERITRALVGAAVGDALGGPIEGWTPEQIAERHGGRVTGIVGPWYGEDWRTARPIAPYHKGDGHVTDDTLMTHALIRVYEKVRDHLDAYAVADHLVPDLLSPRWIPELEAEALPSSGSSWRRSGSWPGCTTGTSTRARPVRATSSTAGRRCTWRRPAWSTCGHPEAAYAEALEVAAPHQSSYGREAAGVFAAAVAAACRPAATPGTVIDAVLALAKDGTRSAIEAVCEAAVRHDDFESALAPLRAAVEPFDTVGPDYRSPSLGARRPSRLHAIEELPVALGMLLVGGGDYRRTVLGSVNYGRDCDSIATMSGAIVGALGGEIPADWAETVAEASRLDLHTPARALAQVAREVFARDLERRRAHEQAFRALAGER